MKPCRDRLAGGNKMQVTSVYENRKLFGALAISMLVCAASSSLTPVANAQTGSTTATIEVKLSEYKIEMPKTVPVGSTTFQVSNTGKDSIRCGNSFILPLPVKRRRAMLASNPSRNSRPELIADDGQGVFFPACPIPWQRPDRKAVHALGVKSRNDTSDR